MEGKRKWKLKRDSLTKLLLYFSDGNVRTFYSLDWQHSLSVVKNRELGLVRLRRLYERHKSQTRKAIFYDNQTGEELEKIEGLEGS